MSTNGLRGHLKLTLIKSTSGRSAGHKACVQGLGLRRMWHSTVLRDTPCVQGMIKKVGYLLKVENI